MFQGIWESRGPYLSFGLFLRDGGGEDAVIALGLVHTQRPPLHRKAAQGPCVALRSPHTTLPPPRRAEGKGEGKGGRTTEGCLSTSKLGGHQPLPSGLSPEAAAASPGAEGARVPAERVLVVHSDLLFHCVHCRSCFLCAL